jgi:adenosylhomocysteine nucleosidase
MTDRPLVLVALRQEAAHLPSGLDHALIGAGKVSAAVATAKAIVEHRPTRILNIGTAGALHPGMQGLHRIGRVAEHDFDHFGIEALTGDAFPGEIVLDPDLPAALVTGDVFVQDEATRARLAARADLVDMEGYAVVRAGQALGVPCELVKIVSDGASEESLRTWLEGIDALARVIAAVADEWREAR